MASTSGSRVIKALMGLIIMVAGIFFMGFLWLSYQRALETRRWTPVPAVILLSQVASERPTPNSPVAHRAVVRYHYEFDGKPFTGTHVKRVEGESPNREKADAIVNKYKPGMSVECFVNPAHPDFAILEHATKAGLYSIWFPFLFVVGGTGMIWSALRNREDARPRSVA